MCRCNLSVQLTLTFYCLRALYSLSEGLSVKSSSASYLMRQPRVANVFLHSFHCEVLKFSVNHLKLNGALSVM
jgi:hypothetical protein